MVCPVCKGSGITTVKHLGDVYILPPPCGGCRGTGVLTEADETGSLFDRMIAKKIEIEDAISEEPMLPKDLKQRWSDRLDEILLTQPGAEAELRALRDEIDAAESDLSGCYLALIYVGLGELARMCEERRDSGPAAG